MNKKERRQRIHYRIRKVVNGTAERPRMVVFRSNKQIYVQVIDDVKHEHSAQHLQLTRLSLTLARANPASRLRRS